VPGNPGGRIRAGRDVAFSARAGSIRERPRARRAARCGRRRAWSQAKIWALPAAIPI